MLTRGDKKSFHDDGVPTLVVFSHPNHELAILGLLQRLRPKIVYLTDGGGPKRISETEEGLASVGLLNQATFLNYTENHITLGSQTITPLAQCFIAGFNVMMHTATLACEWYVLSMYPSTAIAARQLKSLPSCRV